jgi:hypothetical protein
MLIARLPTTILIEVAAKRAGGQWEAVATFRDAYDVLAEPVQPLPPVRSATKADAEARAFEDFKEWANRRWPRRTIPDPVRA